MVQCSMVSQRFMGFNICPGNIVSNYSDFPQVHPLSHLGKKNIFSSMIQFLEFDYNVSFSHNLANSLYIFAIDPFTKT